MFSNNKKIFKLNLLLAAMLIVSACNSGSQTSASSANKMQATKSAKSFTNDIVPQEYIYVSDVGSSGADLISIYSTNSEFIRDINTGVSAYNLVVNPSARTVYATDSENNIMTFHVSGVTPNLSSPVFESNLTGTGASCLQLSPNGKYLFVCNNTSNTVGAYELDSNGEIVSPVGAAVISGVASPNKLYFSADGAYAYVISSSANSGIFEYSYDQDNNSFNLINNVLTGAHTPRGVVFSQDGSFAYVVDGLEQISSYSVIADQYFSIISTASVSDFIYGIELDPNGNALYALTQFDGAAIASYNIEPNGNLSYSGSFDTKKHPKSFAVTSYVPDSEYLYVTNKNDGSIWQYAVDGSGYLGFVESTIIPIANTFRSNPTGITFNANNSLIYVSSYTNNVIYTFNLLAGSGGALEFNNDIINQIPGGGPNCITVSPDDSYLYVCNGQNGTIGSYPIDSDGGISNMDQGYNSNGSLPSGIAFSFGKTFYITNQLDNNYTVYDVNSYSNLNLGLNGYTAGDEEVNAPQGIVFTADGQFAFVAQSGSGIVDIYAVSSGKLSSLVGSVSTGGSPTGLAISSSGGFLYVGNKTYNTVMIYQINISNGNAALNLVDSVQTGNGPSGLVDTYFTNK